MAENETVEEESNSSADNTDAQIIVDAGTLEDATDAVGALVEECKIHLNEDSVDIRAVDPANVGMVDLTIDTSAFEAYNGTGDTIGIDLDRLDQIIGMAGSGTLLNINLNEETRKLNIEFDGLSYTLALIDPDSIRQEPDVPDLDLPGEVVVDIPQLHRGVTASDMVSDHISLSIDTEAEEFQMSAEGDTDDVNLGLEEDDLVDLVVGPADSIYSLDYLGDMVTAMPKDGEARLELGEEFPVKFHFDLADGAGTATYMLAPRIQSD